MNKAILIIGIASAVLSLPYVIEFFGEHKSAVIVERLLVQPTTDKSLSDRKVLHTDDLATEDSVSTINTLLKTGKLDGYSDESRAVLIEDLLHKIDPKLAEIHQSLKVMETIDFPEKEKYQKISQQRIQALEELKASFL
jgi:hypothetical protein